MGPFLYCLLRQDLHIATVYVWITLRLFQAVDAHSGYDFPWSLRHWFPLWAGADHHDYHHQTSVNCFSTSFRHLDYWFGTDAKVRPLIHHKKIPSRSSSLEVDERRWLIYQYHAYKDRQAKAKADKLAKKDL